MHVLKQGFQTVWRHRQADESKKRKRVAGLVSGLFDCRTVLAQQRAHVDTVRARGAALVGGKALCGVKQGFRIALSGADSVLKRTHEAIGFR